MSELVPFLRGEVTPAASAGSGRFGAVDRRTGRELAQIERSTIVRSAHVQGQAIVQAEKIHEIDRLTREAMSGQAMLSRWAVTLAQGDPFIADDLRFFSDIAKLGKGEIIADTVSTWCQEGRR